MMISTPVPSASCQWVKSDCQHSLGLVGLESPIGAFGPLLRFRGDQPGGDENTADGGESRWPESFLLQPGRNRDRAVVQSGGLQLTTQRADPLPQRSGNGPGVAVWATGPGLDRLPAAGLVASHQSVDPTPRHLVSACGFGLAQVLLYDRQDDDPFLRHGSSSKPSRYERCLDSPMNDVLNQDTSRRTNRLYCSA